MDRRIVISCIVLIVIACLVAVVTTIGAAVLFLRIDNVESSAPVLENEPQGLVPVDPQAEPTEPAALDPGSSDPQAEPQTTPQIDPQIARQMDMIQVEVIQERGLEPAGSVTRALYNREQVRQRVLDDFLSEYSPEEAGQDALVLAAFGLLPPGFDLHSLYIELLTEQVAGFYDDEVQEMVVVQEERFDGLARLVYAHEYTHVLQDQNFDIDEGLNYNEEACEDDTERCAAIQALLEGDASLSELTWFLNHASNQDREDILSFYETYESPILDSAPAFLSEDFLFPYEQGLVFVQYLYDRGGWGSVDRAYRTPPVSTEQILHPAKYPADMPQPVELPDLQMILGERWEELDRNVMGEWYTFLLLAYGRDEAARLDEDQAAAAAAGWGGDAYVVYYQADTQATVMALQTVWDAISEADEFEQAFRQYAQERFGQPVSDTLGWITWQGADGFHAFAITGATTTWILAPDQTTADQVWSAIQP
ncbi:MAG: hypothetical protein JW862_07115 [Anaerolineales bacterium]|nr:hypothetical protein [Anaerolineales bacterium]